MHNHTFSHGDDGYKYATSIVADFSSNVWMGGPPDALLEHLAAKMDIIGKYPQLHAESLTEDYAHAHKCKLSQVLVTNGTAEAIFLIAQYFRGSRSTIAIPSFSEYEHACTIYGHNISYVGIDSISENIITEPGLFWLCNPNNPTGHCFDSSLIAELAKANPQTVFIIDEAYIELCIAGSSATDYINYTENIIVLRSMTKHFTIPGLRLGYIVGSEKLISGIATFQPPWSVNSLAIESGHFLLNHYKSNSINTTAWIADAKELAQSLSSITGWAAMPSSTAYFLMKTTIPSAKIKSYLIENHGILIRDASNFRGLDDFHIRICSQSKEKNKFLLDAVLADSL